jgi:hypothetical protein
MRPSVDLDVCERLRVAHQTSLGAKRSATCLALRGLRNSISDVSGIWARNAWQSLRYQTHTAAYESGVYRFLFPEYPARRSRRRAGAQASGAAELRAPSEPAKAPGRTSGHFVPRWATPYTDSPL